MNQPRLAAPPCIRASSGAPGSMRMMSCSLHAGHHSSRHGREDLHAISNVRYDLRWRSFCQSCLKFLHRLSACFLHWQSFLRLCRLCTIRNADCKSSYEKSHVFIFMHFIVKLTWLCRRPFTWSWLETDEMRLETYFAPEISSYSLVSSRSLAFFSQTRLWCLPLYGRYCKQSTYCPNHCIYCTFWTSGGLLLCTCSAFPPVIRCNKGTVKQSAADLCAVASFSPAFTFLIPLIPSLHTFFISFAPLTLFLPAVAEPESQRLRELRQPQRHKGTGAIYCGWLWL